MTKDQDDPPEPNADNVYDLNTTLARKRCADSLMRNKQGAVVPNFANAFRILRYDPVLKGMFSFCEFSAGQLINRPPPLDDKFDEEREGPYPRNRDDTDTSLVLGYLQREWMPRVAPQVVDQAILAVAAKKPYHPVRRWLKELRWDGRPRIDTWLCAVFDAPDTPYVRAVAATFLIGAVRRICEPGCQHDVVMVLEGKQNLGKSKSLRALFGDAWFSDHLPADLSDKDTSLALAGVWCVELAEISQITSRRNTIETIKSFISRRIDRFRRPYGRIVEAWPRQGVFAGSTNRSDWLSADDTGNRRFQPIKCLAADVSWIEVNRDQVWAEAYVRYQNGESSYLDNEELLEEAAIEQETRHDDDVWTKPISEWLSGRTSVQLSDVLSGIGITIERQDKITQMRAASVMTTFGWVRVLVWDKVLNKPRKSWKLPNVLDT